MTITVEKILDNAVRIMIDRAFFIISRDDAERTLREIDRELVGGLGHVLCHPAPHRAATIMLTRAEAIELHDRLIVTLHDVDLNAVMSWEQQVEDAGAYMSSDMIEEFIASAPDGADTSMLRGVLAGRETAGA